MATAEKTEELEEFFPGQGETDYNAGLAIQRVTRHNNTLPIWKNKETMNLNHLILENINISPYFKNKLSTLKTYHEIIDELYYNVSHLEPWEKGTHKTAGQTGMCGGVRGVGAGGVVSTPFCILFKLFTMRLMRKQLVGMINHTDSPYIRALGFMYIRFCQHPESFWEWFEPYFDDEEEVDPKAGGGDNMTIGQFVKLLLTKLDWYGTLFPRIPVPIQKDIDQKLRDYNIKKFQEAKMDREAKEAETKKPEFDQKRSDDKRSPRRHESRGRQTSTELRGGSRKRSRSPSKRSPSRSKLSRHSSSRSRHRERRHRSNSPKRSKDDEHSRHSPKKTARPSSKSPVDAEKRHRSSRKHGHKRHKHRHHRHGHRSHRERDSGRKSPANGDGKDGSKRERAKDPKAQDGAGSTHRSVPLPSGDSVVPRPSDRSPNGDFVSKESLKSMKDPKRDDEPKEEGELVDDSSTIMDDGE